VTEHKRPADQALDLVVYAPIGLALLARDLGTAALADLAKRGRSEVDQAQKQLGNQITQYRFVGQYAVDQELRPRVAPLLGQLRSVVERLGAVNPRRSDTFAPSGPPPTNGRQPAGAAQAPAPNPPAPTTDFAAERAAAAALAIPDYDELSASQVVERLAGLTPSELAAVADYEQARRRRKTILSRIEQLTH